MEAPAEANAARDAALAAPTAAHRERPILLSAGLLVAALVVLLLAYLVAAVPGAWFPGAREAPWSARDLSLTRGSGRIVAGEWVVTAPDATGLVLLSVATGIRSGDYPAVEWQVTNLPAVADVRMLWRSDYAPQKLNSAPVRVEAGRALPVRLANDPAWIGRITGLALAVRTPLLQPLRVRGVVASPMGAGDVLRARFGEWLAFEPWSGASINTLVGGAEVQAVPLPLLVAAAIALAAVVLALLVRRRARLLGITLPLGLALLFVCGWLVLDARWTWNLARQVELTASRYAGKDAEGKLLSAEDGALFAFVEKARAALPAQPARVYVLSDAEYLRTRAAYHLYPHSAYAPRPNTVPRREFLRPGDWVFVYQRRGIQYDVPHKLLRWDGGAEIAVDAKVVEPGAGLFQVRG